MKEHSALLRNFIPAVVLLGVCLMDAVRAYSNYFDFSNFDPTSLTTTSSGQCYKFQCQTNSIGKCYYQNSQDQSVTIYPSSCTIRPPQYCSINSKFSGVCVTDYQFIEPIKLYPGQACDSYNPTITCAYGTMKCESGICTGFNQGEACSQTADCAPNLFCDKGICAATLPVGSACVTDNSCGRLAACHWNDSTAITGFCRTLFTIDNNDQNNKVVIASATSRAVSKGPFSDLLCKSGWSDSNGLCSNGPVSTNAGNLCQSNRDCETSFTSVFGNCICGLNSNGLKFCDLTAGDQMWLDARAAFKDYWVATTKCSIAARWAPCDAWDAYNTWKCKEAQAKYYVYTLNNTDINPNCTEPYSSELPIFGEIDYYCSPDGPQAGWTFGIILEPKLLMLALVSAIFLVLSYNI